MKAKISLVKCSDYEQEKVEKAVLESLNLIGGLENFVKTGQKVLLKPNLLAGEPPEKAVTTHPAVVRAVIRLVKACGGIPMVGDSPGLEFNPNYNLFKKICQTTGIWAAVEEEGAEIVHFGSAKKEVEFPEGRIYKKIILSEAVTKADVIINLPKLKTHSLTTYTGAVKNLFGCIPGLHKAEIHFRAAEKRDMFCRILVDIYRLVKPSLTIMDAVIGMEGEGPHHGSPKEIGLILAGTDGVALDTVACSLIGIDPLSILTNKFGQEDGAGISDLKEIEVIGEKIEEVKIKNFRVVKGLGFTEKLPAFCRNFLTNYLFVKPTLNKEKCKGCGICVRHCPMHAIEMKDGKPVIDYRKCIRCYCCSELCGEDAMELNRNWLQKLVAKKL